MSSLAACNYLYLFWSHGCHLLPDSPKAVLSQGYAQHCMHNYFIMSSFSAHDSCFHSIFIPVISWLSTAQQQHLIVVCGLCISRIYSVWILWWGVRGICLAVLTTARVPVGCFPCFFSSVTQVVSCSSEHQLSRLLIITAGTYNLIHFSCSLTNAEYQRLQNLQSSELLLVFI